MNKLIIFDLDGTLLDSIEDLAAAVNYALKLRSLPLHTKSEYLHMVGHGVRNLVTLALPEHMRTDESIDSALADFTAYYTEHIDDHTRPYPGMHELLRSLDRKGYRIAVASNKFQAGVESLAKSQFPDIAFVQLLGNSPGAPLKPSPEIVHSAMREAGINPEYARGNAVMVGDSRTDLKTASNAGIPGIAVTWGFRPADDFAGETYVADSAELLETLIEKALSE